MKEYVVSVICLGNMVRSPIAAHCLNKEIAKHKMSSRVIVLSRGISGLANTAPPRYANPMYYTEGWKHLGPLLEEYCIDLSAHCSRVVTESHLNRATLILPVHSNVIGRKPNGLRRVFPQHAWKMRLLRELVGKYQDIEDVGEKSSAREFRNCIELINETARQGVDFIFDWIDSIEKTNIHNS